MLNTIIVASIELEPNGLRKRHADQSVSLTDGLGGGLLPGRIISSTVAERDDAHCEWVSAPLGSESRGHHDAD